MNENAVLGTLVKTSLVDFPARVACVLFFEGCNLRCPYCYNGAVVRCEIPHDEKISFGELKEFLKKRQNVLSGFVASGGEALLNPFLPDVLKFARSLGYKTKLDTNGIAAEKLADLLADENARPDYIALDVKTSFARYDEFSHEKGVGEKLKNSIAALAKLPRESREFRSVLIPTLIGEKEIAEIADALPQDADWFFAPFKNENCLNPEFDKIAPYSRDEMQSLVEFAQKKRTGAKFR